MDFDLYHGTYDALCSFLPKNAKVLELGSGPGIIGKYLYDRRPDFQLLLTDVAPNMVQAAQKEVPKARTQVLDVRKLDSLHEDFDAVVAGFVLPYLSEEDILKLMEDLRKSILPQGWIYLSFVPGKHSDSGFISGSTGERTYFWYHSEDAVKNTLKSHGFVLQKAWRLRYLKSDGNEETHTILIAQKS